MKSIFLIFMLIFSLTSCRGVETSDKKIIETSKNAINHCVSEYSRLTGKSFFNEVDRAYVYASLDRLGVLFVHGEVGSFGARSRDYSAYLSCGVLASGNLKIYWMDAPMADPLIEAPEANAIEDGFYEEKVKELFYKRSGDDFIFVALQDFIERDLMPPHSGSVMWVN